MCPLISCNILQQARTDRSRSAKLLLLTVYLDSIYLKDYFDCIVFFIDAQYFQCQRQDCFIQLNCYSLGQKLWKEDQSKRQRQFGDFFIIFRAILRLEYWNLIMKYAKISSLFLEILNYFLIFQNYLVIQLATELRFFRQDIKPLMSLTLGEKSRESQSYLHEALYLSSQMRHKPIILATAGSGDGLSSMYLFSVRSLIF